MALIRREDVWALAGDHVMTVRPGSKLEWVIHNYANAIDGAPEVDAVQVVRCRDCKYGKLCFDANGQRLIQCTNQYYPASFAETWPFELDWYCAGGKRRDGE